MTDVSLFRLYALRAAYLLIAGGLAATVWPILINHSPQWPLMNSVVCSLLAAVSVLAAVGIRYPLQMLPILLFEILWKSIWADRGRASAMVCESDRCADMGDGHGLPPWGHSDPSHPLALFPVGYAGWGYRRMRPRMLKWARGGIMIARIAFGAAVAGLMLAAADDSGTLAQSRAASDALLGRWDLVVQRGTQTSPSWLEVERSGTATLVGQFVGSGGSARPIAKIELTDGTFRFAIPPQWESNPKDIAFEGRLEGDRITGSMTMGDGQKVTWSATRAPALRRAGRPDWGDPITLFNGKSLDGWQPVGRRDSQWSAVGGVLQNAKSGANLVTVQKFDDFKLHLEFRVPKSENSGVYLRGRYELQIDDAAGLEPSSHHLGGLYGFIAPSENVARAAGEWQSMDVTLVGRMLTYELNGTTVISNREIPGITGGALDSAEADPGPLLLQGDHGPVDYRNIVITPAKSAR
jgi:3-keto-disaccharide hydrolase